MSAAAIQPPAERSDDPTLTLDKSGVAYHLRCSDRQVDNIRDRLPPAFYLGSSPRWLRSSIVEWLKQQESV